MNPTMNPTGNPTGNPTTPSAAPDTGGGPLKGVRVIELAGLAPAPFAATMLADFGAEVLRVERPDRSPVAGDVDDAGEAAPVSDPLARGRASVAIDLKRPDGAALVRRLAERADVLLEGFRPGVCERLGIGPLDCSPANPRLVYARLTGWGRSGPLADRAGHDIDYLAIAGALAPLGPAGAPPLPPLNYVADFGAGGMLAVVGILAALYERERSGRGQVVDAAMVDGVGLLTAFARGMRAGVGGIRWDGTRETNPLNGAAPFYRTYACADGRSIAVGAIEPAFYAALLAGLGLDDAGSALPAQWDTDDWPALAEQIAAVFATATREEWAAVFDGTDACVAPVLELDEAPYHPHAEARRSYVVVDGSPQPAPAPRLSRTPGAVRDAASDRSTAEVLAEWGIGDEELARLRRAGVISADTRDGP